MQGTDQPCRMNEELPVEAITEVMSIDDVAKFKILHTARARHIFIARANECIKLGIFTEVDMDQLAIYANTLEMYEKASKSIAKKGAFTESIIKHTNEDGSVTEETEVKQNPYLKHYKTMIDTINKIGSEFGFSPVSRTKINAGPQNTIDPFEAALKQFNQ